MPSIFTNDTSKGPLYQYWKDRAAEEKTLRGQRIDEARIRSHGFQPMSAAYGPSSSESYQHRRASGPPGYENDAAVPALGMEAGVGSMNPPHDTSNVGDDLPPYVDTTTLHASGLSSHPPHHHPNTTAEGTLLSSSEEKSRLAALSQRHRATETNSDAAIAQTLSSEFHNELPPGSGDEDEAQGQKKPTGKERRRSMVGKVGTWLADAASGYTRRQERW